MVQKCKKFIMTTPLVCRTSRSWRSGEEGISWSGLGGKAHRHLVAWKTCCKDVRGWISFHPPRWGLLMIFVEVKWEDKFEKKPGGVPLFMSFFVHWYLLDGKSIKTCNQPRGIPDIPRTFTMFFCFIYKFNYTWSLLAQCLETVISFSWICFFEVIVYGLGSHGIHHHQFAAIWENIPQTVW